MRTQTRLLHRSDRVADHIPLCRHQQHFHHALFIGAEHLADDLRVYDCIFDRNRDEVLRLELDGPR